MVWVFSFWRGHVPLFCARSDVSVGPIHPIGFFFPNAGTLRGAFLSGVFFFFSGSVSTCADPFFSVAPPPGFLVDGVSFEASFIVFFVFCTPPLIVRLLKCPVPLKYSGAL